MILPPSWRFEAFFVSCVRILYTRCRCVYDIAPVFSVLDVLHRKGKARGRWVKLIMTAMVPWCRYQLPGQTGGMSSQYLVDPLLS